MLGEAIMAEVQRVKVHIQALRQRRLQVGSAYDPDRLTFAAAQGLCLPGKRTLWQCHRVWYVTSGV